MPTIDHDPYRQRSDEALRLPSVVVQLRKLHAAPVWLSHDPGGRNAPHEMGVNVRPARAPGGMIVLTVDHAATRHIATSPDHTWRREGMRAATPDTDGYTHTLTPGSDPERITCEGCGQDFEAMAIDLLYPVLKAYVRHQRDGTRFVAVYPGRQRTPVP